MILHLNAKTIVPFLAVLCLICTSCVWENTEDNPAYLSLDDSEFPYADLPRVVIETEDFLNIRNAETKIPAKLQIWGKDSPKSDVLELTLKGHGNSSIGMSKYSLKLEFEKRQAFFDMPKDKDWVLISNHADKTLLRNYATFKLASWLNLNYVPRCEFVELYLNREYMGVYLWTENIKTAKKRVNLIEDGIHYLVEVDTYHKNGQQVTISKNGLPLRIHAPKTCNEPCQNTLKSFIDNWEDFIAKTFNYDTLITQWIDIQDYTAYYWVEEFAKNIDSNLRTSVFFTWEKGGVISMGPIWDFDLSYGSYKMYNPEEWYSRWGPWNKKLIENAKFKRKIENYWKENRALFLQLPDSLNSFRLKIQKAANNNFKRWPILETTFLWEFNHSYSSHQEAVDSLESWMRQRINWIDKKIR